MDPSYRRLEFDVKPEPGPAEIDDLIKWGSGQGEPVVRHKEGTDQIRLISESGYQILLVRPDAEHKDKWQGRSTGKKFLLQTHLTKPGDAWTLSWVPGKEISVDILRLSFLEDVGNLVTLQTSDTNDSYFPIPKDVADKVQTIFDEPLYVTPWAEK